MPKHCLDSDVLDGAGEGDMVALVKHDKAALRSTIEGLLVLDEPVLRLLAALGPVWWMVGDGSPLLLPCLTQSQPKPEHACSNPQGLSGTSIP